MVTSDRMFDNQGLKNTYLSLLIFWVLVGAVGAQTKGGTGYSFVITIHPDKTSSMSIISGYETSNLDAAAIQKALLEYRQLQDRQPKQPYVEPRIFVQPHPSVDIGTLASVARSARISAGAEVKVNLARGAMLLIPRDSKFESTQIVRPNPLTLVLRIDGGRRMWLNNEEQGSISDSNALIDRLRAIFKAREDNGVFREGTNEIEKTVYIKMHPRLSVGELDTIASSLEAAGSDRIGLQIDDLDTAAPARRPTSN